MSFGISKKTQFLLRVWYMDCVDNNGNTFIAYSLQLNWKTIYLNFNDILINRHNENSFEKGVLSKLKSPSFKKNNLLWEPDELIDQAEWVKLDKSFGDILLSNKRGFINWSCAIPRAMTTVQVSPTVKFKGLGHAQFIEMNIHPWSLPYDTMRWGRFVSKTDSLVWIQWRGEQNVDHFYLNEILMEDSHFYNDEIRLDHGKHVLTILESVVLRSGRLNKTVLAKHPIFKNILPERVMYAKETMWKGKAILKKEDGTTVAGWVIHDFVQWG